MPSTYTLNNGIELIATGEQSGTWGDTTNTNLSLLDTALDGQVTVTLPSAGTSGSPNTLAISDGAASDGRNRMVIFNDGGDLGATAYVQLTPNDAEKIIYVRNDLAGSRSIILFQGTYNASNDYELPAGTTAVIFFDGAGSGAVAANVFNNAYFDSLRLGSVSVTAILDEDDMSSDSATSLATQQSIKAYVDSQVTAQDLDFAGDSGTGAIDLDSQTFTVAGTANQITTAASGQTVTISLPATIATTTADLTNIEVTNIKAKDGTAAGSIADSTGVVTLASSVLTTTDINGGTADDVIIGGTTAAAGSFTTVDATGNITSQGQVITDTINEQTATSGVTVDGVLLKDGGATFTADVSIGANDELTFNSTDLRIFSDGVDSFIKEGGSGNLRLQGANVQIETGGGNLYFSGASNVARLYHTNLEKLATTATGVDVTGNATFADDGKAIFGAGSDLAIYHDGLNSFINDQGIGDLRIQSNGDKVNIFDQANSNVMAHFNTGGSVDLYHNGSQKLATTSTGIDVTGTVTADGLTVNGNGSLLTLDNGSNLATLSNTNGNVTLDFDTTNAGRNYIIQGNNLNVFKASNGGDISFYEDTGTTPKFFWDASAESLGIGTSSPARGLHVNNDGEAFIRITSSDTGNAGIEFGDQSDGVQGAIFQNSTDNSLRFNGYNNSEAMRIDSSGNLLIGGTGTPTSSAGNLVLYNGTAPTGNATDGVILYAEDVSTSSELKVRDEAGNVTTLSPHNFDLIPEGPSEDMAWSYYSERDGKRINVDMLKAIRLLEQISGEKLVHMV